MPEFFRNYLLNLSNEEAKLIYDWIHLSDWDGDLIDAIQELVERG